MIDFTVPLNPGWGKRVRDKYGAEDGDILAISPTMLRAIDTLEALTPPAPEETVRAVEEEAWIDASEPESVRLGVSVEKQSALA